MGKLLENKFVRFTFYTICLSIVSEIMYRYFKIWKNRISSGARRRERNEVIWTNNLTQTCTESHNNEISGASPNNLKKMMVITRNANRDSCKSEFCYLKNIAKIINLIDETRYTIDLAMYIFTQTTLSDALMRALKRGVRIRIICEESMAFSSGSQVTVLNKSGIPIRYQTDSTMLMHHKFCIFDGPKSMRKHGIRLNVNGKNTEESNEMLLTGSTNWTFQGLAGNWDNIIITSNASLIVQFENEFERMWNDFNKKGNFFPSEVEVVDMTTTTEIEAE